MADPWGERDARLFVASQVESSKGCDSANTPCIVQVFRVEAVVISRRDMQTKRHFEGSRDPLPADLALEHSCLC